MSSNPDSFIDEVTEAVRRDRLFALFRRYGWIGVAAILLIVGIASWSEWSKYRAATRAQGFGDAVLAALQQDDPAARATALAAVPTSTDEQAALLTLLAATTPETAAALDPLVADADLAPVYRDLAAFRRTLAATDLPAAERRAQFEALASPGAPLRLLAEEQIALIDVAAGETAAAVARLQALSADTEASGPLRRRSAQVIVALGGTPGG